MLGCGYQRASSMATAIHSEPAVLRREEYYIESETEMLEGGVLHCVPSCAFGN